MKWYFTGLNLLPSLLSFPSFTKTKWAGISLAFAFRWTFPQHVPFWSVTYSPSFPLDYNGRMVITYMMYGKREWKTRWCNSFKILSLLYRVMGFSKVEIITGRQSQGKRQKLWKLENSWESCLNRTPKTLSKTLLLSLDNGISLWIHLHER